MPKNIAAQYFSVMRVQGLSPCQGVGRSPTCKNRLYQYAETRDACLLIHGYGGSPAEMEGMARALQEKGFAVNALQLPGHGEDKETFASCRFGDWLAFAEKELAAMLERYATVCVVGFSMGGTLALNLAARFPVSGVAVISAPLYVLHILPWPGVHARFYAASGVIQLGKLLGIGKRKPNGVGEPSQDTALLKGYGGPLNVPQLYSFRRGCIATRKLLPRVTAPLLAIHDVKDRVVYAGNACEIARRVSSRETTVLFTRMQDPTTRHHLIITHRETESFVTGQVVRFCLAACSA